MATKGSNESTIASCRPAAASAIQGCVSKATLAAAVIATSLVAVAGGCGRAQGDNTAAPQPSSATLDPNDLRPLPAQGLVVERAHDVLLVGLDGKAYGKLEGFRLRPGSDETGRDLVFEDLQNVVPDRVVLSGPHHRWYVLDPEGRTLERLPRPKLGLEAGLELIGHASGDEENGYEISFSVERDGKRVIPRTRDVHVVAGSLIATPGALIDPIEDVRWKMPQGCVAAGLAGDDALELCGPKPVVLVSVSSDGARRTLSRFPSPLYPARGMLSPDGADVAAVLAPGCGAPWTFLTSAEGGSARVITGGKWSGGPNSYALGWSADNRLVAHIENPVECDSAPKTGVYLVDPKTLERAFVFRDAAAMWGIGSVSQDAPG